MKLNVQPILAWALFALALVPVVAGDAVQPPFLSPDGSQTVGYEGFDITDWSADEIARFGRRPDIMTLDVQSGKPPGDHAWAYQVLVGHLGKRVSWVETKTFGNVTVPLLCSFVLAPSDQKDQLNKEWEDSGKWQELLIKPPVGMWGAVQDSRNSTGLGPWGGGADGQGYRDGVWWGAASSTLQGADAGKGSKLSGWVKVTTHGKAIAVEEGVERFLATASYYRSYEAKLHLIAGQPVVGHRLLPERRGQRDYWSWFWRSGSHLVQIGGDVEPDDDLLAAYLAKFPSDLPRDLVISVEATLVSRCQRAVAKLSMLGDSPDEALGWPQIMGIPWNDAMEVFALLQEGRQTITDYQRDLEGIRKTMLEEGRRYDWVGYQTALKGLRERYLERFSTLVSAMEKSGVGHTGKAFAVKLVK